MDEYQVSVDQATGPVVQSIDDWTPPLDWFTRFYFFPYTDLTNTILLPALLWAVMFVWIRGLPNTFYQIYKRGWDVSTMLPYVKIQAITLWRGPLLLVYYTFRAATFLLLLPYNIFVFFGNVFYLPLLFVSWSAYVLRAWLWFADAAYVLSKFWILAPADFIETFILLVTEGYLFVDILFFWYWIPVYSIGLFWLWLVEDTFQERPTRESLYDLYLYG